MGELYVEFCGESCAVPAGGSLSFGRDAELEIDTNPYLHRLLGRFVDRGGHWFLDNVGSGTPLHVHERATGAGLVVLSGHAAALTWPEFVVSFTAGPLRYELAGTVADLELDVDLAPPEGGERTLEWGIVELTDDQRLVLVALCEPRLRDPLDAASDLPTNRHCAARLGWTLSKFSRKLDHLCLKFARSGVTGLHGEYGGQAADRRRRLVEHVLTSGLVTSEDLVLMELSELRATT